MLVDTVNGLVFDYDRLIFFVNGERIEVADVDPRMTLASYLRDKIRLTGTKIGCNEGGCGACTVMVSEYDSESDSIKNFAVNACLMPVCAVFGKAVTTVEGIGSSSKLHSVQERLSAGHGTQCGFCTPGFVVSMYALLKNNSRPEQEEIDEAIQGNLCRCTGYRPILEGFYSFARRDEFSIEKENGCLLQGQCCKSGRGENCKEERKTLYQLTDFRNFKEYDASQELIFPPELKVMRYVEKSLRLHHKGIIWYKPKNLFELLHLRMLNPQAKIICGNTEVGVELKHRFLDFESVIYPKQILELRRILVDQNKGVFIGSAYTMSESRDILLKVIGNYPEEQCAVFKVVIEMLHWFANSQIRNVATFAGNLVTASPISDLNPIWMCSGARVALTSPNTEERILPIDDSFFVGYRKTVVKEDELVLGLWIPFSRKNQHVHAYKQAQRRGDDITIVTGAFNVELTDHYLVKDAKFSFSGIGSTTKMAMKTAAILLERKWNENLLNCALIELQEECALLPGVPGGMERYRVALVKSFFFKYFFDVCRDAKKLNGFSLPDLPISLQVSRNFVTTQFYQSVPCVQPVEDPVGKPLMHQSARKHTTGEAVYCQDVCPTGTLWASFVTSPIACGYLKSVDIREARLLPGFRAFFDYKDLPDGASHGPDTPIFVNDKISYHCQPIGMVVAEDHESARRAANLVKVHCVSEKPVVSIEDAMKVSSYFNDKPYVLHSKLLDDYGEKFDEDFGKCDSVIEGAVKVGGQEHFYLETHNVVVVPGEDDELQVIASTQGCDWIQRAICKVFGLPQHKVTVKTRRIGGGFGGKESASLIFALPAVLAARRLKKPVKIDVERIDDMAISGNRHPFKAYYKVGLSKDGSLQNLRVHLYANAGHSLDLSVGVIHRAMTHVDNVYRWPNADIFGTLCKTNLASNTAFRGFGAPQGMFVTETIMKHAAEELGLNVDELREKNLYRDGDCTPFGSHLKYCNIHRCWTECVNMSEYENRKEEVLEFNRSNKFSKRGIYMAPTKFGIAFTVSALNQGGAFLNVYLDGSVLITIGGVEMGQGLYIKVIQVAARSLGIDPVKIHVNETSTEKVPNASPTAASIGSDLYGFAVKNACDCLMGKLKRVKEANPNGTWEDWIKEAYLLRIPLSVVGFSSMSANPVDFEKGIGNEPFSYFVYGVACSEVEVDCLTGDHRVRRVDIVMDVGDSLNPAIDIGQIEGAFVQGYGLFTMEELKVREDGRRITRGPGTYKIPTADDIPRHFNVKLLKGSSNKTGIFSSKGVGEPPLFLGVTPFFAIREAVRAFRMDYGQHGYFRFDSPATPERIRLACEDEIMTKVPKLPDENCYTPWTVEL